MKRLATITRVVVACIAFATAYIAVCFRIEFEQQRAEYTRVIESIGEVAELMHDNSDVMLRYKHYTGYHLERKYGYCLECNDHPLPETSWELKQPAPLLRDPKWVNTWNPYILSDIEEINRGIRSFVMQLRIQHVNLRNTLHAMRESTGYEPHDN